MEKYKYSNIPIRFSFFRPNSYSTDEVTLLILPIGFSNEMYTIQLFGLYKFVEISSLVKDYIESLLFLEMKLDIFIPLKLKFSKNISAIKNKYLENGFKSKSTLNYLSIYSLIWMRLSPLILRIYRAKKS